MKPQCYDKILCEDDNGVIFEFDDTVLFESIIKISGETFILRFNASYVPVKTREWFCQVLGKQYQEDMNKMFRFAQKLKQDEIKKALGV